MSPGDGSALCISLTSPSKGSFFSFLLLYCFLENYVETVYLHSRDCLDAGPPGGQRRGLRHSCVARFSPRTSNEDVLHEGLLSSVCILLSVSP